MKLKIVARAGVVKVVNADTGEAVENVVHLRFEMDAKHGWLGYVVFAPDVNLEGEFERMAAMPAVRGYEKQHQ